MNSNSLHEQLKNKLGLNDEPHITEKSTELLRLLEMKASNISSTFNDYSKIVLCIHLACEFLNIPIDQNNAFKLSGLKKTQYQNSKRTLEKILDLTKPIGVKEICVQLGLTNISVKATEILKLFQKFNETNEDVSSHPQYAAMSIYQASKILKKKLHKQKLVAFSHLKPAQWTLLEKQFDRLVEANTSITMVEKSVYKPITNEVNETKVINQNSTALLPEVEDYDAWKMRILKKARSDLENLLLKQVRFDKENI